MKYEVWLSEEAVNDIEKLKRAQERKLRWWRDRLVDDPTVGDPIRKSLIPAVLQKRYRATNLFRLELPEGWRILYTIVSCPGFDAEIHILRVLPHKEYEKLLGYRG
ncbi:MAG: hypothetical protein ACE5QW_04140 [Thermoplasmata archaeon]